MFVETLDDKFKCPICQLALKEPKQTECGHHVCATCLTHPMGQTLSCPTCRTELEASKIFPDNSLKRDILKLKIQCHRNEEGCEWVGELKDHESHDWHCGYVRVVCAKECGEMVMRKNIDDHVEKDCLSREVRCGHCESKMKAVELQDHSMECDMYPVNCSYDCDEMVPRHLMADHVGRQGTCPNSPLVCDFKNNGCQFQGTRAELLQHIESNITIHLTLIAIELSATRQTLEVTVQELTNTKRNLTHELAVTKQTLGEELAETKQKLEDELVKKKRMEDELAASIQRMGDELGDTKQKLAETEHRLADVESKLREKLN